MPWPTDMSRLLLRGVAVAALAFLAACTQPEMTADTTGYSTVPAAPVAAAPERVVMLTINFDFDSHRIRPEAYQLLDNLAVAMHDPSLVGYRFDINGHTDIVGRLGYNIALSTLRAQAVVNYLVARGVPRESLHVQGFGPLQLLDPAHPASGVNRRVEVVSIRP